ncbi:MAG: hypothetical protein NVS2B9_03030 [Myxococcales bacterium]
MLALAIVFAVLATLIAPSALGWYFTPPEGGVVMMKGDDAVRWGIRRLIQAQLVGLALGALLGLVIGARSRSTVAAQAIPPPREPVATATPGAGLADPSRKL